MWDGPKLSSTSPVQKEVWRLDGRPPTPSSNHCRGRRAVGEGIGRNYMQMCCCPRPPAQAPHGREAGHFPSKETEQAGEQELTAQAGLGPSRENPCRPAPACSPLTAPTCSLPTFPDCSPPHTPGRGNPTQASTEEY